MPGLMISIIDPVYRNLLKHDKEGKPKWNEVPEIARVSVRCLRTPGHTADSISLVMCEGEKGVFTGDTVLGQGTTVFTDLTAYMSSLNTLLALKPSVLYPAHGPHLPTRERATKHISDYITHRQEREDQIVKILQTIASDPDSLSGTMGDIMVKVKEAQLREQQYNWEFFAGKPHKSKDSETDPEVEEREKTKYRQSICDKFPSAKAITIPLMCRILYQTDKETLVNAASKSVDAHLRKLEGEGTAKRVQVRLPVVTEGNIGDAEDMPGWEWIEDGKIKLD